MPGGGRITVETATVTVGDDLQDLAPGAYVRLTVSDTGCGMTGEVRSHLFEPFFTTKAEGKGTGLGLATVYGIVKQARGDVRVESAPGRGTRFDVYLPAAPAETGEEVPAPVVDGVRPGDETVLLAEDDAQVRAVAAQALRRAGYTVLEAPDGEAALALAAGTRRLDVLVADVVMPHLGGVALAARLRALRGPLPVVFVTGYGDEGPSGDDPSTAVLQKPFDAATLTRTIREQLTPPRARSAAPITPESRG
jgi:CheY-like chemotaxis protein